MALDTATKAPLIVTTAAGVHVPANDQTITFSPEGIAQVEGAVDVPDVGSCWYIAGVAPGTTTLTVTGAGSSGSIAVTVTEAPLALAFAPSVPR